MNTMLKSNVTVTIAGQSHQIRWDKAALFELGSYPEATEDVDVNNGAALFRRAIIYLFCCLKGDHPYKSPKDIAAVIGDDEVEGIMDAINNAIMAGNGGKEGVNAPLANGPSPDAD